jgi:hypothetical protein
MSITIERAPELQAGLGRQAEGEVVEAIGHQHLFMWTSSGVARTTTLG